MTVHANTETYLFPHPIDEQEFLTVVKHCKRKSSAGYDGIDMCVVKRVISHIAKPLTYICNISFETGIFPNDMKVVNVSPVYKIGEKNHLTTTGLSLYCRSAKKILEKHFDYRLEKFMEQNKRLSDSQYGFGKKIDLHLWLYSPASSVCRRKEAAAYRKRCILLLKS